MPVLSCYSMNHLLRFVKGNGGSPKNVAKKAHMPAYTASRYFLYYMTSYLLLRTSFDSNLFITGLWLVFVWARTPWVSMGLPRRHHLGSSSSFKPKAIGLMSMERGIPCTPSVEITSSCRSTGRNNAHPPNHPQS